MKIINFGSLNVDHVYEVRHFVSPGETIPSSRYARFCGGKGLNQSIALARAGARVMHAGKIGADGKMLRDALARAGVDTSLVVDTPDATGHAVIQVTPDGQNAIIIAGGANQQIDQQLIGRVMEALDPGDWLLLQNEINAVDEILTAAQDRGATIAYNPAPMTSEVEHLPLESVHTLFVNQVEGEQLTRRTSPTGIIDRLLSDFARMRVVLTLGEKGAILASADFRVKQQAFSVAAVDTTAAGDTFVGYYLAAIASGDRPAEALRLGCLAASLCVTRRGAAESIPGAEDVQRA